MIRVFENTTTNFNNNGLGVLSDAIACKVNEQINGAYELTLEYPLFGSRAETLIEENIIMAPTPSGDQPFRIYSTETSLAVIYVNARHVFYDLLNNFLDDVRPTSQNGAGALNWILRNTQFPNNFTSNSNITANSSANYVRKNVVEALIGDDDNSYINRWGGELMRDKWNVVINDAIGEDRGVKISYGKNLMGLNASIDTSQVITRVMVTGLYDNDTVLFLPERYVDSPYIDNYTTPKIAHFHYSDIKVSDELTEAQAIELLREQANLLFTDGKIDEPNSNIVVEFLELSKTEEYKDYSILETIYPWDIVTVEYLNLGFSKKAKMISYEYDALLNKYDRIELGDFTSNYAEAQGRMYKSLKQMQEIIDENKSDLEQAIDNATVLLTNALGGYVYKRNGEILIMNTEDPNTATKVWRFNLNGLGYSSTGINGPYGLAMTMDGAIVADFITTGTLSANLIKAGILSSSNNSTWINMVTGAFSFANGKIAFDGNNLSIDAQSVKMAIGEIGGDNIIKNGAFKMGLANWTKYIESGSSNSSIYDTYPLGSAIYIENNNLRTINMVQQVIDIDWNGSQGEYTFSGWMYSNIATIGTTNPFIDLELAVGYTDGTYSYHRLKGEPTEHKPQWTKYSSKFTATKNIKVIYATLYQRDVIGETYFTGLHLYRGSIEQSYKPHPSELKGTNYIFDSESFKIGDMSNGTVSEHTPEHSKWTHSDGSYTQAGVNGLERYIAATGNKYHSLVRADSAIVSSGTWTTITLPNEFKNKDFFAVVVMVNPKNEGFSVANYEMLHWYIGFENQSPYIDKAAGTIRFYARAQYRNLANSSIFEGDCKVNYIVIA